MMGNDGADSDDEGRPPPTKRGRYQDDVDLDAYINHLQTHGGPMRTRSHHLLTTTLAQVIWYGDLPMDELRALRQYRTLYFPLNTDNPITAGQTGGSHWFLVVLVLDNRQRSACDDDATTDHHHHWVLILDSVAGARRHLPRNEHTERNLKWLTGRETADVRVRNVVCPQQTETECGLCTLANLEVLYRWQDWDPETVDVMGRSCPVDRLRSAYARFVHHNRRRGGTRTIGWFFTDERLKEEKSTPCHHHRPPPVTPST